MKRAYFMLAASVIFAIGTAAISFGIVHRGAAAEQNTETAGITGTASVSIGTSEQIFDLDICALTGEASAALQVEEVLVRPGQQVQKGTALLRVTADSVQGIRTILQRQILDTSRAYELLKSRQEELRLEAAQEYDSRIMDGKYASLTYSGRCDALQAAADAAKEDVDRKQDQVNENLLELTQTQQDLAKAQKYLNEAQTAVSENYENRYDNAYYYAVYENTREQAAIMVRQLEEQTAELTAKNESLLYEVSDALCSYHQTMQDLERERLTAKMECDRDVYASQTASEQYEIEKLRLDSSLREARLRYESALQKIRVFDAHVVRGRLLSTGCGSIADIMVKSGDNIGENDIIVTFYEPQEVTMDVLLCEEDYLSVNPEAGVNIIFPEYPDKIYEGAIAMVSGAESDSRPEKTEYMVTVVVQGDVSGLYEGMQGTVKFF